MVSARQLSPGLSAGILLSLVLAACSSIDPGGPIDREYPDTTLINAPEDPSFERSGSFAFTSSKPDSTFECKFGSPEFQSCNSPFLFGDLSPEVYQFEVRAVDTHGLKDPTPATYQWTVNFEWIDASLGARHSCGIHGEGHLFCWGQNSDGQIGDAPSSSQIFPKRVESTQSWISVAAGLAHTCAIKMDGSLWCWGRNNTGQLGQDDEDDSYVGPQRVGTDEDWRKVSAGSLHNCALKEDQTLWCWGGNSFSQVPLDSGEENVLTPQNVSPDTDWAQISMGRFHGCAVKEAGALWCWGRNTSGQLGIGPPAQDNEPELVQVGTDDDWALVRSRYQHTCGLKSDGTLWCWGYNYSGQLGIGTATYASQQECVDNGGDPSDCYDLSENAHVPTQVDASTNWISVSTGDFHTCALRDSGRAYCWGDGGSRELGDGDAVPTDRFAPGPPVDGLDDGAFILSGYDHNCVIKESGTLWCWGDNNSGQLGNNSVDDSGTAMRVYSQEQ